MPVVRANGIELFYRDDGAGMPALFVQGLGVDHRGWGGVVRQLMTGTARRCISFDNRDVGRSSIMDAAYDVTDMARDAVGLLDALGVEQADIVGHSMGGVIAQEMAIRWPARVRRLVLIATYTSGDPRGSAVFEGQAFLRRTLSREDYCRATFWSAYSHQDYRRADGFIETMMARTVANDLWQPQDAYERHVRAVTTVNTEARLGEIAAPTLIIAGAEDILTPMRFAETLAAGIRDNQLLVVEGAAHGIIWSHAGAVAAAIGRFLLA